MTHSMPIDEYSRWPHRLAVVLACATFPLIWVGGLVTTYDAGMAVPDWPNTYGYNLFLYPMSTWLAGPWDLFIEHGHRLLASFVGLLTIGFVVVVWAQDKRPWVRWFSLMCLALVVFQGVLGGARVLLDELSLARLHGCIGPLFFVSCVAAAVVTSRWWRQPARLDVQISGQLQRLALSTVAVAYLQLVVGAHLRHLSFHWSPGTFRGLVAAHLIMAVVVVAHAAWLAIFSLRNKQLRSLRRVTIPTLFLVGLVLLQVLLGLGSWAVKYSWPTWLPPVSAFQGYTVQAESMVQVVTVTAHVAVGSLILAIAAMLAVRAARLYYRSELVIASTSIAAAEIVA